MNDKEDLIRLSWTKLQNWQDCRQKVKLLNEGHRNPTGDVRNFLHGNVVDGIMRDWLSMDTPEPGLMQTLVPEYIERSVIRAKDEGSGLVRWKSSQDYYDLKSYCIKLLNKLEPILNEYILPYEYSSAQRFEARLELPYLDGSRPVLLVGELDLLVKNEGYRIWDLKATRNPDYYKKSIGQLVFYDISILCLLKEKSVEAGFLQPMCEEPIISFAISEDQRRQMLETICRMAQSLWAGEDAPKVLDSSCYFSCPVSHACEHFRSIIDNKGRRVIPLLARGRNAGRRSESAGFTATSRQG